MSKALVKEWQQYKKYTLNKYAKDLELYKEEEKLFKDSVTKIREEKGVDLWESSMRTSWQQKNHPQLENRTFENFMNWMTTQVADPASEHQTAPIASPSGPLSIEGKK